MVDNNIGAVIVNFRTPDLTINCVQSILKYNLCSPNDIVVVENFSEDGSFEKLSCTLPAGVKLIASRKNNGFGAGVNIGVSHIEKKFLIVLNPDTYFIDSSLMEIPKYFENNPKVGIIGLDLRYPNGDRQWSARKFYSCFDIILRRSFLGNFSLFRRRIESHLMMNLWKEGMFKAEWVMGTGFVVRKDFFISLKGMDESYFLYMEDVDLCAKFWKAGLEVHCIPGCILIHDHQRSSSAGLFSWAGKEHIKSLLIFRKKHGLPLISPPGVNGIK